MKSARMTESSKYNPGVDPESTGVKCSQCHSTSHGNARTHHQSTGKPMRGMDHKAQGK